MTLSTSCRTKSEPTPNPTARKHGAYIVCEGNYGWGKGEISYFDLSGGREHEPAAYTKANGFSPGNVAQSLFRVNLPEGERIWLVVNNSNKMELLDLQTLVRQKVVDGLTSPRYLAQASLNKLYLTDLYSGFIRICESGTGTELGRIKAPGWTEKAAPYGKYLVIANRRPNASPGNIVNEQLLWINTDVDTIEDSTKLSGIGCQEAVFHVRSGLIWTAVEQGNTSHKPELIGIDPVTRQITRRLVLDATASRLTCKEAGNVYFLMGGKVGMLGIDNNIVSLGSGNRNVTALCLVGTDTLIVGDSRDYVSASIIYQWVVSPSSASVQVVDSMAGGVIAGDILSF